MGWGLDGTSVCLQSVSLIMYYFLSSTGMSDSDEIQSKFYERLRKRILSKVGNKSAFGMDCWEWTGQKKIGREPNYGIISTMVEIAFVFTRTEHCT